MTTKTCPQCAEEISDAAKKCPRCHSYQSKLSLIMASGIGTAIFFIVLGLLFYGLVVKNIFPNVIYDTDGLLTIVDSKQQFSDSSCSREAAVIGTVQNFSNKALTHVHFQVKFLNSKGEVIDVITDKDYDIVIPPSGKVMFKARGQSSAPEEEYHSHEISITKVEYNALF